LPKHFHLDSNEERIMSIARILVATDVRQSSRVTLEYAAMLATRFASELHILHVVPDARREPWADEALTARVDLDALTENWIHDAEHTLQGIAGPWRSTLDVHTATRVGTVSDEILAYVEGNAIDLVGLGVTADGVEGGWLHSGIAERIARRSPCLVLTVPERGAAHPTPAIRTILIAVDFNPHADEALTTGLALAAGLGATVHVLHVFSPPWVSNTGYVPPPAAFAAEMVSLIQRKLGADVNRRHDGRLDVRTTVRVGKPASEILDYARSHPLTCSSSARMGGR
jgi:nucleotide-binding universal stress UspA family protein